MSKGEVTRAAIVAESLDWASVVGLNGLSIGGLAGHTGMSKSGLFAHFGSKESLQLAVLEEAERRFIDTVVRPAWRAPEGITRIRALFDRWLDWEKSIAGRGGCIFMASASELDDQPGATRDRLVTSQRKWQDTLAGLARRTIRSGEFRADLDAAQFAHELKTLVLGFNHASRLLQDPLAEERTRRAFEALVTSSR